MDTFTEKDVKRARIINIQSLQIEKEKLLKDLQQDCKHGKVIGAVYEDSHYSGVSADCLLCGLHEGGTDEPLKKLKGKPTKWMSTRSYEGFVKQNNLHDNLLPLSKISKIKGFKGK